MLNLYLQNDLDLSPIPSQQQFETWVKASLQQQYSQLEQLIRIVDESEIQALNNDYRGKDKTTNILSFPAEQHQFLDYDCLGDLVICANVVAQEAKAQDKPLNDHWAHLVIHGMLHLQGFDHVDNDGAKIMESKEVQALATMGISNPYES